MQRRPFCGSDRPLPSRSPVYCTVPILRKGLCRSWNRRRRRIGGHRNQQYFPFLCPVGIESWRHARLEPNHTSPVFRRLGMGYPWLHYEFHSPFEFPLSKIISVSDGSIPPPGPSLWALRIGCCFSSTTSAKPNKKAQYPYGKETVLIIGTYKNKIYRYYYNVEAGKCQSGCSMRSRQTHECLSTTDSVFIYFLSF